MMGKSELTGLFGAESNSENTEDDSIPEDWKSLQNVRVDDEELVHSSVGVNMFYDKFSDSLDHGRGRDELIEEVYKHVTGDYDIPAWDEYEVEDVVDLQIYLLDELDREGSLRGKEVVNYLEDFVRDER